MPAEEKPISSFFAPKSAVEDMSIHDDEDTKPVVPAVAKAPAKKPAAKSQPVKPVAPVKQEVSL